LCGFDFEGFEEEIIGFLSTGREEGGRSGCERAPRLHLGQRLAHAVAGALGEGHEGDPGTGAAAAARGGRLGPARRLALGGGARRRGRAA